jgi:hypothetical protein
LRAGKEAIWLLCSPTARSTDLFASTGQRRDAPRAHRGQSGGGGRPAHCHNLFGLQRFKVYGEEPIAAGEHQVCAEFA